MALNLVQVEFVGVARRMVERLIKTRYMLDAFVLDFDNQQTPLPTTPAALEDNPTGSAARVDAPNLTGAQVTQLRTFCANMRDQISGAALNTLVNVAVRDIQTIIGSHE